MCRKPNTPIDYKHEALINELNEFMIAIKVHLNPELFGDAITNLKNPKPSIPEIDGLHNRLRHILQQDALLNTKTMKKYCDLYYSTRRHIMGERNNSVPVYGYTWHIRNNKGEELESSEDYYDTRAEAEREAKGAIEEYYR